MRAAAAELSDDALHSVQRLLAGAHVVFELEVGGRLVHPADVAEQGHVVHDIVKHADSRVDAVVVRLRVTSLAARHLDVLDLAVSPHRLRAVHQRPLRGELPAVHRERLDVLRLVVHLGGQAVLLPVVVAVVAARHLAIAGS